MAANATERPLDPYARSVVEHTAESTERDISWLDRLITAERARLTATGGPAGTGQVGPAHTGPGHVGGTHTGADQPADLESSLVPTEGSM
jgi:hypothetical protein